MSTINDAQNLLRSVVSTMDTISVSGIDNMDKFVGCANAVSRAIRMLADAQTEPERETQEVETEYGR